MKNKGKNFLIVFTVGFFILLLPFSTHAETKTLTGKIIGFNCLTQGYTCPIDKKDPMLSLEKDFVLVTPEQNYYFLVNIGMGLKARYALDRATVTGEVNEKYRSIKVNTFETGGKVVWSQKMEDELYKQMYEGN